MRIDNPTDWIIARLQQKKPLFAIRYNDGEMAMMYRTVPEGKVLGTDVNPATTNYQLGSELRNILEQMIHVPDPDSLLIGCSWDTERADEACKTFEQDVRRLKLTDLTWCNEHWPLDGVVDGSTMQLLDFLRESERAVLVTNWRLAGAVYPLGAKLVLAPTAESWNERYAIYNECLAAADAGCTFVWAGGIGLKPTAWQLWKRYPQSSHIDIGHLFNGAFGIKDYGWLQRGDGPWHQPYFENFVPYVRRFLS